MTLAHESSGKWKEYLCLREELTKTLAYGAVVLASSIMLTIASHLKAIRPESTLTYLNI